MIYLVVFSEKMILFFPKMWSYSLDGKWKMIFLQKNTWKYDISFKCPEKTVFQKNCSGIWSFLYYLKRWVFFPGKYDTFPMDKKWKMIFLKKYVGIWYFLYICMNVTNMILPYRKKKKKKKKISDDPLPKKNTLKGNWHSRSHSSNKLPTISKYSSEISESAWSSFEYPTS